MLSVTECVPYCQPYSACPEVAKSLEGRILSVPTERQEVRFLPGIGTKVTLEKKAEGPSLPVSLKPGFSLRTR